MAKRYEGLAKQATVFASLFGISLGLCGATALFSSHGDTASVLAVPLGFAELLGMVCGLLGLVVVGLFALFHWLSSFGETKEDD